MQTAHLESGKCPFILLEPGGKETHSTEGVCASGPATAELCSRGSSQQSGRQRWRVSRHYFSPWHRLRHLAPHSPAFESQRDSVLRGKSASALWTQRLHVNQLEHVVCQARPALLRCSARLTGGESEVLFSATDLQA